MLTNEFDQLKQRFLTESSEIKKELTAQGFDTHRVKWMGRKGILSDLVNKLRTAPPEQRPALGKSLNELKNFVSEHLDLLLVEVRAQALEARLQQSVDISLPVGDNNTAGGLHPITLMRNRLLEEFRNYGFTVYDGPEIDSEYYNFTALNIPESHPARDMQDTFFVEGKDNLVLRTHTSPVQIHCMLKEAPPLRVVAPGRVFRVDSDATHTPMFHQLEALLVDRGITFAHLKGVIQSFLRDIYGQDLKIRFRPSFFPFVEPGAEVDLQCTMCRGKGCRVCSQTGWLEVGGCGMVHPNVFESVEYDSEEVSGFAFGFGIDRLAMLAYRLPDLRQMFEGDYQLQTQFPAF